VAMRLQLASGVNILLQVSRLSDGSRKVTHITEVLGFDAQAGTYQIQDLFVRHYKGTGQNGEILSDLAPTGAMPACLHQLREHGVDLPASVHEAIARRKKAEGQQ
jgi:pilus assembly protein CpaF